MLCRAVDFGYFCARVPLLIFGRDPGTRNVFLQIVSLFCCMLTPALLATASASVYVLYSTRLYYLSQLAPSWRIVHSELDTPHTSARPHEGSMHSNAHPSWQHSDVCGVSNAKCTILWTGSSRLCIHELDTPHTCACHHEGFCIRMHILRDDVQTCF